MTYLKRMRGLAVAAALVVIHGAPLAAQGVAIPCVGSAVDAAPPALTAADKAFRTDWRDASPNWFTAFEAKPPKRNIFDKAAETEPALETIKGIAWAHGLFCLANLSPDGSEVLVRYFARVAAFHEGKSWSKPFDEGLLRAYLVKRRDTVWTAQPVAVERTILLPGSILSLPAAEAIPPTDPKLGIPCRSGTAWNGKTCTTVAAQTTTSKPKTSDKKP
jgi:hypothetical protein